MLKDLTHLKPARSRSGAQKSLLKNRIVSNNDIYTFSFYVILRNLKNVTFRWIDLVPLFINLNTKQM